MTENSAHSQGFEFKTDLIAHDKDRESKISVLKMTTEDPEIPEDQKVEARKQLASLRAERAEKINTLKIKELEQAIKPLVKDLEKIIVNNAQENEDFKEFQRLVATVEKQQDPNFKTTLERATGALSAFEQRLASQDFVVAYSCSGVTLHANIRKLDKVAVRNSFSGETNNGFASAVSTLQENAKKQKKPA